MITTRKIGVLMGGTSREREVSLKSGSAVLGALLALGLDAVAVDAGAELPGVLSRDKIEAAFITLHGRPGENGAVQGLLEVMGIPYTGSGVLASALAMDKEAAKKIFLYHGLTVPDFRVFGPGEVSEQGEMDFPLVVKPACEGSSIGVSIARDVGGLKEALDAAFDMDDRVVVEKYIEGKEVNIGVMGGRALGGVEVRPSLEFYSYKAKYTGGLTEYILPPEISGESLGRASADAVTAHTALGCRGATRVDFIVDPDGAPHLLEVNTIPGMTETSLLPKIAAQAGMGFKALVGEILEEAFAE